MSDCRYRFSGVIILILVFAFYGCATPFRAIYRGNDDSRLTYISNYEPPLKMDIPGTNWKIITSEYNFVVLQSTNGPRMYINIFEYNEGFFRKRFYKKGFAEEEAIEEYSRAESEYHISKAPDLKRKIIAKDIDGPITPNILWSLEKEQPDFKIVFITMSKNRHLISISAQDLDSPSNGQAYALEIFHSLKLLTKEQVDLILETETNLGKKK